MASTESTAGSNNTTTNNASAFKGSDSSSLYSDAKCFDQLKGPGQAKFYTTNGRADKLVEGNITNNMSVIGGESLQLISIIVSYTFPVADADSSHNVGGSSDMTPAVPETPRLGSSEFKTDNFGNNSSIKGEPGGSYRFETTNGGKANTTRNDVDRDTAASSNADATPSKNFRSEHGGAQYEFQTNNINDGDGNYTINGERDETNQDMPDFVQ
ncbi:hypothetical protein VNI00_009434 [Paramarasmius palmivorus]|uniref:Uncharacterized protein n=1 Tax=Paramarasmius palmivorus TaxID=297713 RepID=A0AAW0CP75_9AGAR